MYAINEVYTTFAPEKNYSFQSFDSVSVFVKT